MRTDPRIYKNKCFNQMKQTSLKMYFPAHREKWHRCVGLDFKARIASLPRVHGTRTRFRFRVK